DQTTTAVVIFTVGLEVALQLVDVGGQQGYLHFRATGVAFSLLVLVYDLGFFFNAECHVGFLSSGNCRSSLNRPGIASRVLKRGMTVPTNSHPRMPDGDIITIRLSAISAEPSDATHR